MIHFKTQHGFAFLLCLQLATQALASPHNNVDYRIDAKLDEATERVHGLEHVTIINHTGRSLPKLYFHVYPNAFRIEKDGTYMMEIRDFESPEEHLLKNSGSWLRINSAGGDGDALYHYSIKQELLTIDLPAPLEAEQKLVLTIDFDTQLGPIAERSGVWDGNYSVGQWFPKLMVYDSHGWALEHNAGYHAIGEFYGDFGSYKVDLTVPRGFKVGATGHKTEETALSDGLVRMSFEARNVHDFAWTADRKYVEQTVQVGHTTIHAFTRNSDMRDILEYAKMAFEYFTRRVGPYPYDDFTVSETYYNGTMEYPQLIFVRSWPAKLGRFFEDRILNLKEIEVEHETGHQWFYGVVGNNEVVNAWLDEGFTTYLEEAYMRDMHGSSDNVVRFTNLLKVTDRELGDAIWRLEAPDVLRPTQTPSYLFDDPMHYYASVYYKVALFFRHFESLLGKDKFDAILREYYRRNMFHNAEPDDWYGIVREMAGSEAERWWRDWITGNLRSDFSVGDVSSKARPGGGYTHRINVAQEGQFYVPVDVELRFRDGTIRRMRAPIDPRHKRVVLEASSQSALASVEVDPDHVAPDVDRFNNKPGFFPSFEVFPLTTRKFRDDAVTLAPLPLIQKKPGLGLETGLFLGAAHYLDWYGFSFLGWDWRNNSITVNALFDTLQPELELGWTTSFQRDAQVNRGAFYLKKSLGPGIGHDPRHIFELGPEWFGRVADAERGIGVGVDYLFSNLDNGHAVRYSLNIHNSYLRHLGQSDAADRLLAKGRLVLPIAFKTHLDLRVRAGTEFGTIGQTSLFNLQGDEEGAMRFDYANLSLFRVRTLKVASAELQLPIPYSSWSDSLGLIHGPTWELHFFADASPASGAVSAPTNFLFDAGIGTRIDLALGGYGTQAGLGVNLELVPYQNVVGPGGLDWPVVLLSLADRLP